jgi:hypothetical protein
VNDDRSTIRRTIEDFIRIVEASGMDPNERLEALPGSLDALACAVHRASFTFDERDFPDAPRVTLNASRALVTSHFPALGYYNLADPTTQEIGSAAIVVGDGIDDIADIYADLKDVLWYWDNTSVDDALWHFTHSFGSHWGLHLRSLQYYLHVLASGTDVPADTSLEHTRER